MGRPFRPTATVSSVSLKAGFGEKRKLLKTLLAGGLNLSSEYAIQPHQSCQSSRRLLARKS